MMMPIHDAMFLAVTRSGVEDNLLVAILVAIVTAVGRWGWILSEKNRGMKGYYVGSAIVVTSFPDEPDFPKAYDVCYQVGYSRIPWRFRITSYSRVKDSTSAPEIDVCRGGWRQKDYVSLEYSKQKKTVSSFGRAILKFTGHDPMMLNGSATGVSKGMFRGKDVVYAVEIRLKHQDKAPGWVALPPT